MNPTTTSILYGVKSDLEVIRGKMELICTEARKPLKPKI